jgi:Flp pilus assembly protein TadD
MLANFLLDAGETLRAHDVLVRLCRLLPQDPLPQARLAWACRRLGRADEAQQAIDQAHRLDHEDGTVCAAAAALALDRGELDNARNWLDQAVELAPGDPLVAIVQAQWALATATHDEARQSVASAVAAVEASPFAVFGREIAELKEACSRHVDYDGHASNAAAHARENPP